MLVNALIVAAYQNQPLVVIPQAPGVGLVKGHSRRADDINSVIPLPRLLADVLPALVEGISLHHRPPAAAVGVVVHLTLFI